MNGARESQERQPKSVGAKKVLLAIAKGEVKDQSDKSFKYQTIDYDNHIRILKIYKGAADSNLQCRLIPCPFQDSADWQGLPNIPEYTKYVALSYYWGTDEASNPVEMYNDDDAQAEWGHLSSRRSFVGIFLIQDNLNNALRHLRSDDEDVYVWTDALCINQGDKEERAAQVAHMHKVYAQAHDVCIWLREGRENENSATFEFLRNILDLRRLDDFFAKLELSMNDNQEKLNGIEWVSCLRVIKLMQCDYFSRRWIVQELALATKKHVRCGSYTMEWDDFADAIALFITKHEHIKRASNEAQSYHQSIQNAEQSLGDLDVRALGANVLVDTTSTLFRRSNEGKIMQRLISLEQLVSSMLLPFEATDPRDTVFAVLQIAKDTTQENNHSNLSCQRASGWIIWLKMLICIVLLPLPLLIGWFWIKWTSPTEVFWKVVLLVADGFVSILPVPYLIGNKKQKNLKKKEILDRRLKPNYKKSLTDIWAGFIEYCIEQSGSLDILCRHWAPGAEDQLPSWILTIDGHAYAKRKETYHNRVKADSLVGDGSGHSGNYHASGKLPPEYKFGKREVSDSDQDEVPKNPRPKYAEPASSSLEVSEPEFDGKLKVRGFKLGEITNSKSWTGGNVSVTDLKLLGWSTQLKARDSDVDQLWRTLVANRGPDGRGPAKSWYRRACLACLDWHKTQRKAFFSIAELRKHKDTPQCKIEFLDRVEQVVWGRKVFTADRAVFPLHENREGMKRKLVGMAPSDAHEGNIICILFGCSVPVILRATKVPTEYRFVGECYVDGMMDGEAIEDLSFMDAREWFTLV